ncbi:MAG: Bax inhibitor-1/YccA family protein [Sedimentibacter sp.]|uniref:Bax inhibitor-1/YccA family protein n=1 Tax=Sedimentibacter sp. TaxID=1960295 RepID=UPI002980AC56|nr:Bax inhibitor-1/YccA family protein [Sedimentibacter sp.]MDW5300642.1 Bax inhibitor-1/YccA family protein [Sedimentibacter sp.]
MERYYYDENDKKDLINKVLNEFFVLLLICTIGMIIGKMFVPPQFAFIAGIGSIIVLIVATVTRRSENRSLSKAIIYSVAFLMGISTFPTILYYVSTIGSEMVLISLGITTVVFGSLALYSSQSKRDFTFLGGTLFVGLIALILISIVGLFLRSEIYHLAIAWLGILIFSGYVLHDISLIKNRPFTEDDVPRLALNLFLDFINIFIYVLRIVSRFNRRN